MTSDIPLPADADRGPIPLPRRALLLTQPNAVVGRTLPLIAPRVQGCFYRGVLPLLVPLLEGFSGFKGIADILSLRCRQWHIAQ